MGAEQEKVVLALLGHTEGRQQNVDAIVALMSDDIVYQVNGPSGKRLVGREACRTEIEGQNSTSTGNLPGSELRNMASNDRLVLTERVDVVEVGGRQITIPVNGVFEVEHGKVTAWRDYFDMAAVASQLGLDLSAIIE